LTNAAPGRVQPGNPRAWSQTGHISELPANLASPFVAYEVTVDNQTYRGATIHVVVADQWGNCVSFTHTLGGFFGGQDALGNTGVIGNNGMDWFDLDDVSPWTGGKSALTVEPGKRNRWTLSPGMVFKDGRPYILIGGSGAETTMPGIFQTLIRMLEYNLNPMAALSSPRFMYGDGNHYTSGTRLAIEPEIRVFLEDAMKAMGHDVVPGELSWRSGTGTVMVLQFDHEHGGFAGGAEPRSSGSAAIGY